MTVVPVCEAVDDGRAATGVLSNAPSFIRALDFKAHPNPRTNDSLLLQKIRPDFELMAEQNRLDLEICKMLVTGLNTWPMF